MGGGWWPKEAATYRPAVKWLPVSSLRFDAYVDHLCRTWLGRTADARLLKAATQAVTGPENWAIVTASTHGHQQALAGDLAVPAAGQRPPRHSRPHDDVRQTMTDAHTSGRCRLLPRLHQVAVVAPLAAAGSRGRRRRHGRHPDVRRRTHAGHLRRHTRWQHHGGDQPPRRHRRTRRRRTPWRPRLLQGTALDRHRGEHSAVRGPDVRAAPRDGSAGAPVALRRARGHPGDRSPGGQPLALLRDRGGGGRRTWLRHTQRMDQPDDRPRPHRTAHWTPCSSG